VICDFVCSEGHVHLEADAPAFYVGVGDVGFVGDASLLAIMGAQRDNANVHFEVVNFVNHTILLVDAS